MIHKNFFSKMMMLCVAIVAMSMTMLTSCSSNEDNRSSNASFVDPYQEYWQDKTAKYTIMLYGCGGGNVDTQLTGAIPFIQQRLNVETNQVRFVVMYSMSKDDSMYRKEAKKEGQTYTGPFDPDYGAWGETYRYELTPYITEENYRENGYYKQASEVKLYDVETIKEFINWAKETAPAENYILIPTNHGGGFDLDDEQMPEVMPEDSLKTRAIVYDDNQDGRGIPTKAFAQALKETNTHLKAVYWNGCMMSQLEVMTEIAPYCDYQFGGAHVQRALPRHSYAIVEALNTYPDNFEQAALLQSEILNAPKTEYEYGLSDALINSEDPMKNANGDFGCWRSAGLAAINAQVKELADVVTKGYADSDTKGKIDNATSSVYMFDKEYNYVDVLDYALHIYYNLKTPEAEEIYLNLEKALEEAKVYQICCLNRKIVATDGEAVYTKWPATDRYSLGISLYSCLNLRWLYYNSVYKASAFDKVTGWSKFIDMNLQELDPNVNPANDSNITPFWMAD